MLNIITRKCKSKPPQTTRMLRRFTEHGPAHQDKTQFPSQSVSHQEASGILILIHQRTDRMKTTITEN